MISLTKTLLSGALLLATGAACAETKLKIDLPGTALKYDVSEALEFLASGKVVTSPTDTSWSLHSLVYENGQFQIGDFGPTRFAARDPKAFATWLQGIFPSRNITASELDPVPLSNESGVVDLSGLPKIFGPVAREYGPGPLVVIFALPDLRAKGDTTAGIIMIGE